MASPRLVFWCEVLSSFCCTDRLGGGGSGRLGSGRGGLGGGLHRWDTRAHGQPERSESEHGSVGGLVPTVSSLAFVGRGRALAGRTGFWVFG